MAANPPKKEDTPKNKNVSKMMVDNILSYRGYGYNRTPWNATWERIIFSQDYKEKEISSVQLKLNTDLVLNGSFFNKLLLTLNSHQSNSGNPYETDPIKYTALKFEGVIGNILPGKHYCKYKKHEGRRAIDRLYVSYSPIKNHLTSTGVFEDIDIIAHIGVKGHEINTHLTSNFQRERIGLSYNPPEKFLNKKTHKINFTAEYINLEIKFDAHDGNATFRTRSKNEGINKEESHPKKEIVLNIHLYNKNDKNTLICNGVTVIPDKDEFKKQIITRLEEFSKSFIFCSAWLNNDSANLTPLPALPAGILPPAVRVSSGDQPIFYSCIKNPKKKQGYKLLLIQNLPQNGISDDLEIYIERSNDHQLNFTMLNLKGTQINGVLDTPHITIPPILTQEFLNDEKNQDSIFAYMATKKHIGIQKRPPYRSPEIVPLASPSIVIPLATPLDAAIGALSMDNANHELPPPSQPVLPEGLSQAQLIALHSPIYSPTPSDDEDQAPGTAIKCEV